MNDRNDDNLRELFEQFWDSEQAQSNIEDIARGEQILREHPAPEPDDMLLADIKAEIALHVLPHRATMIKRIAYRAAAVAAAIIVIVAIGTSFLEKPTDMEPGPRIQLASVFPWSDSDDITTHDANLVVLTAQIEQIENELIALDLGEKNIDSDADVAELEMDVVEIAGDFWKG